MILLKSTGQNEGQLPPSQITRPDIELLEELGLNIDPRPRRKGSKWKLESWISDLGAQW